MSMKNVGGAIMLALGMVCIGFSVYYSKTGTPLLAIILISSISKKYKWESQNPISNNIAGIIGIISASLLIGFSILYTKNALSFLGIVVLSCFINDFKWQKKSSKIIIRLGTFSILLCLTLGGLALWTTKPSNNLLMLTDSMLVLILVAWFTDSFPWYYSVQKESSVSELA